MFESRTFDGHVIEDILAEQLLFAVRIRDDKGMCVKHRMDGEMALFFRVVEVEWLELRTIATPFWRVMAMETHIAQRAYPSADAAIAGYGFFSSQWIIHEEIFVSVTCAKELTRIFLAMQLLHDCCSNLVGHLLLDCVDSFFAKLHGASFDSICLVVVRSVVDMMISSEKKNCEIESIDLCGNIAVVAICFCNNRVARKFRVVNGRLY